MNGILINKRKLGLHARRIRFLFLFAIHGFIIWFWCYFNMIWLLYKMYYFNLVMVMFDELCKFCLCLCIDGKWIKLWILVYELWTKICKGPHGWSWCFLCLFNYDTDNLKASFYTSIFLLWQTLKGLRRVI